MNGIGGRPIDPRKLAGYAFVAGMVLAPFLALIYGWNIGLGVMALALAAATYLAVDVMRTVDDSLRPRLRMLVGINGGLAILCVVVLLVRAL